MKHKPDKEEKIWFPSIHQIATNIESHSWYNIKQKCNTISTPKKLIKENVRCLLSKKYKLYPTKEQIKLLNIWFDTCIDVYNLSNQYIISKLFSDSGDLIISNKNYINFFNIRKELNDKLSVLCDKTKINKHTLD